MLISILSTLFSFFTSHKSCLREIEILDCKYENKEYKEINLRTKITSILNINLIIAITLGLAFQVVFSYTNLNIKSKDKNTEVNYMSENGKKYGQDGIEIPQSSNIINNVEKGLVIPKQFKCI